MASIYEDDVIRYLRQKNNTGGFDAITFLGAEQRYVNALRNSGINNLEEQYILGTDTYTEVYTDADGNTVTEKSFHVNSDDPSFVYNNYYKLVTTDYKDVSVKSEFYFDGTSLMIPNDSSVMVFGDGSATYPDLVTLYGVNEDLFEFTSDGSFEIFSSEFIILKKEELFFVTDSGATEKPVLTKTTSKRYLKNGGRVAYREDIVNHIAS